MSTRKAGRSAARARRGAVVMIILGALLALVAAPAPPAAAAAFSTTPDATLETNGDIYSIAQAGGRTFLGGNFTRAGAPVGPSIDVSQSDGTPGPAFGRVNGTVSASVSDGAGGWFIAGSFTRVGAATRNRVAHLLADGSLDPSFDPNVANNAVFALALSGTTLYAGGTFTLVNGATTRNRLAAFDTATGLATSFDPNVNDGSVSALAFSAGTLYAGGTFSKVGGAALTRNRLAAFDAATGAATAFDANANGAVNAVALSGTTLYAGGAFTTVNGTTSRSRLAALDTTTGSALAFDANVNNTVNALAQSGGTLYAAGIFTTTNNGAVTRNRVAAFDGTSGTAVAAFNPSVIGQGMGMGNVVTALAVSASGTTLYIGGTFLTVNGTSSTTGTFRNNLAAVNTADGVVVAAFDPNVDGNVATLAVGGSRLFAGGNFLFAGAATLRNRLAAMRPDGTLDPDFNPNANGTVFALAASGTRLYAGGGFTTLNGSTPRANLASLDPTTGTVDLSFNPAVNSTVTSLVLAGSKLYAGGNFTLANTNVLRNRLAAFDAATGTVDPTFNPDVSGLVNVIALSGGKLYAGGLFTTVNGTAVTRNRLAAFDPATGAVDAAFNPNVNEFVGAMAVAGGKVYAGGVFTIVNGSPGVARNRLASFDATTGAVDTAFNPNVNGQVFWLGASGGLVYVGGSFQTVAGATRNNLAAVDAASGALDPFNPNMSSNVNVLLLSGTRLLTGGTFTAVGTNPRQRFAQFSNAAPGIVSGAASAITGSGASLAGTVDPHGLLTTYVFEYGTSPTFGSITAADDAGVGEGAVPVAAGLSALAANTTYYYRLVGSSAAGTTFGGVRSFRTTGPPQAPAAVTQPATGVDTTSAVLHGGVNPSGQQTAYTFEYGTSTAFGAIAPVVALDDADALEPVSATLTGLAPDTTYYVRVVATNATGTTTGAVLRFSTGPGGAPIASTGAASAITATTATLAGTVDAHGSQTAFAFEYGTSNAFGSLSVIDSAGDTNGAQAITLPLTGLDPATTYHYRIVATNTNGTTTGVVNTFTTPATT